MSPGRDSRAPCVLGRIVLRKQREGSSGIEALFWIEASRTINVLELEAEARRRTWPNLRKALEKHMDLPGYIFGSKAPENVVGRKKLQISSRRFYTIARLRNSSQTA